MTEHAFRLAFPHCSASTIRENRNRGVIDDKPAGVAKAQRRTLEAERVLMATPVPPNAPMRIFRIFIPVPLVSELNQETHWRVRAKRAKVQKQTMACFLDSLRGQPKPRSIYLCRSSARTLDQGNLEGAFKYAQDAIAEALGFDDRDACVKWYYSQVKNSEQVGFSVIVDWSEPTVCTCCGQVVPLTFSS